MAKTPKNHGKPWSNADTKKLADMANHNRPTGIIAWELDRTQDAVRSKASEEGISLKPTNKSPYNRLKK